MKKIISHIVVLLLCISVKAQTLIINEFSNGPTGSKEYVEFVVVDSAVVYDCTGSAPPCIDIRGWIFDDNSGYHGTNGQAAGAVRFANHPLWACLPVGTIILVYNGNDPNVSIPADDVSMADGNCTLIMSLNDLTYFEFTETTPGAAVCSYPATGWGTDPFPDWSNVGMANSGDCARIVDLNGCEVFSVCYGSCNQNTMIYFAGSGADDVWSFGGGDPQLQSNWTQGCAGDISACGSNDQTPGAPNNIANSNYIAQFNNNCAPISLLTSNAVNTSICGCTNTATVTASGSIPGYTYEWYDNTFNSINQTTATATGLCGGTYHVITTSSIGCEDTVQVVIGSSSSGFAGADNTFNICESNLPINLFDSLGVGPDLGGVWIGPSALTNGDQGSFAFANSSGIYGYVITGTGGCPNDTAFVDITVSILPDAGGDGAISICTSGATEDLFNSLTASPQLGGVWSPALTSGAGVFDPALDAFGNYQYTISGGACPDSVADVIVTQVNDPIVTDISVDVSCFGANDGSIDLTIASASVHTINWILTNGTTPTTDDVANLEGGMQNFTITNTDGCVVIDSININEPLQISVNHVINAESCPGACDGSIAPSATNGTGTVMFSLDGINFVAGPFLNVCAGNYNITAEDANGCQDIGNVTVQSNPPANPPVINSPADMCVSSPAVQLTANVPGGTWSGVGITDPALGVFDPNIAGVSAAQVIYTIPGACGSADTNYINITTAPSGSFTISDTTGCAPLTVDFESTILAATAFTCEWDFDNGSISTDCNAVTQIYTTAGCYNPTLSVTDATGCEVLILFPQPICTVGLPDASFTTNSLVLDEFNAQFNASNSNLNIDSYDWFLDGNLVGQASDFDMNFSNEEERAYDLCLAVENSEGCVDTSCVELTYQGSFSLYVPNAFSPNGDGKNDLFIPVMDGQTPEEFNIVIFNRWGEIVYESDEVTATWDGNHKSLPAQMEVYNWKIEYKLPNSPLIEKIRGHVTLIR